MHFQSHAFCLGAVLLFLSKPQPFKEICFSIQQKLKTRFIENGIVIPCNVFEGPTCEQNLQNHALSVGEIATLLLTYVIYNSKSHVAVVFKTMFWV